MGTLPVLELGVGSMMRRTLCSENSFLDSCLCLLFLLGGSAALPGLSESVTFFFSLTLKCKREREQVPANCVYSLDCVRERGGGRGLMP